MNPGGAFDSLVSRDSFECETQPVVEPLEAVRQQDLVCRLQMPVLSEYYVPNNRGWFAMFDSKRPDSGMFGVLGLYGAHWEQAADNLVEIYGKSGATQWRAPLAGGKRHWLLYAGPTETDFAPDRRFVFHRLHAEFNALRLDEHLDLTGDISADEVCWAEPGLFEGDDHVGAARKRIAALPCLAKALDESQSGLNSINGIHRDILKLAVDPSERQARIVYDAMSARFDRWVRGFQGFRTAENDYAKNVIGFSRLLRGLLIAYELLRKGEYLEAAEIGRLTSYFGFAARRILDEGRWPHSRTYLHPDHPDSVRGIYAYGGEHNPDRLVWTNSLPNFQSDPMCALAHLSCVFRDHTLARDWRAKALDDIDRQLDAYAGKSGAWVESANYALYSFSYFMITFRLLKNRWGINYFQDKRVRRLAAWLCRFFGPYDKRFGVHTWPGVGNVVVPALGGAYLLAYASELDDDDPLRDDCMAIYQLQEAHIRLGEHYGAVLAAMAPIPDGLYSLTARQSENMDEVGVSLRHDHLSRNESYLFQKIGFAKDHYEGDETSFNWYAKGTPFLMDYGTYTSDVAVFAAHNLVEIPDADELRRGYLAERFFSPSMDFTHCETPVTQKLLYGRPRSFAEIDRAAIDREKTPYYYIGDDNPVGPKLWKVRLLVFVKPDYVVLFDRVHGMTPHRYNLHFTGGTIVRDGATLRGTGRFDLDLLAYVQHPKAFQTEIGELVPNTPAGREPDAEMAKHRQSYVRVYNETDNVYRTLLFAKDRVSDVRVSSIGRAGMKVETDGFTDYVFVSDERLDETEDEVRFVGRVGWIRRSVSGLIEAAGPDCDMISAFGTAIKGRGPWVLSPGGDLRIDGTPRTVRVVR
jgi:hypothetical protein